VLNWPTPVTFVNGRIVTSEGEARTLRIRRRIVAIDAPPQPGDKVVDLDGRFVLPGLINAHDHLELNHYGPLKVRDTYGNAREWIGDLAPVIRERSDIREKSRIALADRLFIGGLKNLLAGVTTVGHHNPMYRAFGLHFPVRLVSVSAGRTRWAWNTVRSARTANREEWSRIVVPPLRLRRRSSSTRPRERTRTPQPNSRR
jgi:hypothetical protein